MIVKNLLYLYCPCSGHKYFVAKNMLLITNGYTEGYVNDPLSSAKIKNVAHQSNIHLCLINKSNKTLYTALSGNFPRI